MLCVNGGISLSVQKAPFHLVFKAQMIDVSFLPCMLLFSLRVIILFIHRLRILVCDLVFDKERGSHRLPLEPASVWMAAMLSIGIVTIILTGQLRY